MRQVSRLATQNLTNSHSESESEAPFAMDGPFLAASSESYLGPNIVSWARKSAEGVRRPAVEKPRPPPRPVTFTRKPAAPRERGVAIRPAREPLQATAWSTTLEDSNYRPGIVRVPRPRRRPDVKARPRGRTEVNEEVSLGSVVAAWADTCAAAEERD